MFPLASAIRLSATRNSGKAVSPMFPHSLGAPRQTKEAALMTVHPEPPALPNGNDSAAQRAFNRPAVRSRQLQLTGRNGPVQLASRYHETVPEDNRPLRTLHQQRRILALTPATLARSGHLSAASLRAGAASACRHVCSSSNARAAGWVFLLISAPHFPAWQRLGDTGRGPLRIHLP